MAHPSHRFDRFRLAATGVASLIVVLAAVKLAANTIRQRLHHANLDRKLDQALQDSMAGSDATSTY